MQNELRVGKKYHLGRKIGSGSFGGHLFGDEHDHWGGSGDQAGERQVEASSTAPRDEDLSFPPWNW